MADNSEMGAGERALAVIEAADTAFVVEGGGGRVLYVNPAAAAIAGVSRHDLVTDPPTPHRWVVVDEDSRPLADDEWPAHQVLADDGAHRDVVVGIDHPDGARCWVQVSAVPFDYPGADGDRQVLLSIRDITAERDRTQAAVYRAEMIDAAGDAIVITDVDGKVTFWNRGAEKLYGWHPDEVLGHPILEIIPIEGDAPAGEPVGDIIAKLADGRSWNGDLWSRHRDGHRLGCRVSYTPVLDHRGEMVGVVGTLVDLTDRFIDEARLHERELLAARQISDAHALARQAAEEVTRAKDEFLSRMSHELRTPLNAVIGYAQLLEHSTLDTGDAESVAQIRAAGSHLLDLINEVLDITAAEAAELTATPSPVAVADAVRTAVDLVQSTGREHAVTITVTIGAHLTISADRRRTVQVLVNLLANAVKYNRPRGTVSITAQAAENDRVRISVIDSGPGLTPEDLERVFVPFERLATDRNIEGTGIGLSLSRRLVEAMGGTLQAESKPGYGSVFWFELPAWTGPDPTGQTTTAPVADPATQDAPVRVLNIEDNAANQQLIERALNLRDDATVITAPDGHTGLALAQSARPDLVLLDLHLPDMNGVDVLNELRHNAATAHMPVVIVSADATPIQISQLLAAGAADYLTKPLNLQHLLDTIRRLGPHPGV